MREITRTSATQMWFQALGLGDRHEDHLSPRREKKPSVMTFVGCFLMTVFCAYIWLVSSVGGGGELGWGRRRAPHLVDHNGMGGSLGVRRLSQAHSPAVHGKTVLGLLSRRSR